MRASDSFDLSAYLATNDPHSPILKLSFSVHSLPTLSSLDSIPPFPGHSLAHKVHLDTYLSLHQPITSDRTNAGTGDIGVLLAAPTAPRLRNMMGETLHIKKWLSGLAPTSTFPIRKPSRNGDSAWKAEGSLYNPDEFAEELRKKRCLPALANNRAELIRNTLVIEQGDMDNNVSCLHAATIKDDVNPPKIFTKTNLGASPRPAFGINRPDPSRSLSTPSLMVSTSDAVFPISLESSSDISGNIPATLAARRGKKTPPHLSLKQGRQEESYPSIPTAFLGVSNEQWFQHGHIAQPGDTHIGLKSMISALQSHRIAEPFLPGSGTKGGTFCLQNKATENQDSDSDEWAIADAFVSEYGDLSLGSSSGNAAASLIVSSNGISDSETSEPDGSEFLPSETCPSAQPSSPPITTLPQGSVSRSPPQEMRGILKGCKNVRFASLPIRQCPDEEPEQSSWPDRSAPQAVSTHIVAAQHIEIKVVGRASTLSSCAASRVRSRPPNPFRPMLDRQKVYLTNQLVPSSGGSLRSGAAPEVSPAVSQRHTIAQLPSAAVKIRPVTIGRLRRMTDTKSVANKDKGKRLTIKPKLDENAARRDGSSCQQKDTPARKRLQTPLRTILTRFNK